MSSFVIAIFIACWPAPETPPGWACRSVSALHPSESACHRWTVGLAMGLRGQGADRHEIVKAECLAVALPAGPQA
jgi:hypothetical protein